MKLEILLLLSSFLAFCSAGGPSKKARDPKEYAPAVLEPGCPVEINTCMQEIHNASRCLTIMRNLPGFEERKKCTKNGYGGAFAKWWGASMEWHDEMRKCIAGQEAPVAEEGSRRKRGAWGSPELQACWAERKGKKESCISLMLNRCPRLTACMGMGDRPQDPELQAWWDYMNPILIKKQKIKENFSRIVRKPCPKD